MEKTSKDTINAVVWKACDTFRNTVDSSSYKNYILGMLFFKYLSDTYREAKEEVEKKFHGKDDRMKRAMERLKFKLDKISTFEYLVSKKDASNIGDIINKAFAKIEEDNQDKLASIFSGINFNDSRVLGETKERNAKLKNFIEDFNSPDLDLRPSHLENNDIIGDAYEYLIYKFAEGAGKKGGEFFTPSEVSVLISELVEAKDGDRIYDPTCGSGSLLIKVAGKAGNKQCTIYGQEKNSQTFDLCRMNMYLHEIDDAHIEWGDTILNPRHLLSERSIMRFDIVVANPPFSLDKWGEEFALTDKFSRFDYGVPPKSKGDYAFVIHMINSLNENGKMAVVLPHGVLFRGAGEGNIRKKLIKENLLDAVIGLPPNLFFGTSIPACILIFKKRKSDDSVVFIDASKSFKKGKKQNYLKAEDITKISKAYKNRKEIDKYCHISSLKEIEENEYNLNIPRYIDTFEEEEDIDITETKKEIEKLEKERGELKKKMDSILKELGL